MNVPIDRPRAVRCTVPVGCAEVSGNLPAIVVYVTPRRREMREFTRFCAHYGVGVETTPEGESTAGEGAFVCVGSPDALEMLSRSWCVRDWHPVGPAPHVRGQGNGPEKPRKSRPTQFGRPETAAATSRQLQQHARIAIRAAQKRNCRD